MKRKRNNLAHVRSIFAPDEPTAQTSLFADCPPEAKPIFLLADPAATVFVTAEMRRLRAESARYEAQLERLAELEQDRHAWERLTGKRQSAEAWLYAEERSR